MQEKIVEYLWKEFNKSISHFTLKFNKPKIENSYMESRTEKHRLPLDMKIALMIFIFLFTARRIVVFVDLTLDNETISKYWTFDLAVLVSWGATLTLEVVIAQIRALSILKGAVFMCYNFVSVIIASLLYYESRPVSSPLYCACSLTVLIGTFRAVLLQP